MEQRSRFPVNRVRGMAKILILSLWMIMVVISGCSQKGGGVKGRDIPDELFAESSVARMDSLLGFSFIWRFSRQKLGMMPAMEAEFSGKVSIPDRYYLEGSWKTGSHIQSVATYSIEGDDYLYDEEEKRWKSGSPGIFPHPLEQLKLTLSFGEFEYLKRESVGDLECYLFSFKPNIYFLDPTEETEPEGLYWVSADNGFPKKVKVTSKKGEIHWEMTLSQFNSFASLSVPLEPLNIRIIGIGGNDEDSRKIADRFVFLGYEKPEVSVLEDGDRIFAFRAERLPDSLVRTMIRKGVVEVFMATWPEDPIFKLREDPDLVRENYGEDAKLYFERGIVTKPIIAVRKILSTTEIDSFEIQNDMLGKYSIYAYFTQESLDSVSQIVEESKGEPLVIVVDDFAVSISRVRDSWLVEKRIAVVKGVPWEESIPVFAKIRQEPLTRSYTFQWETKEE
jgi:hypothetical protein